MSGQLHLDTIEPDEAKRLRLTKRFDQYEWPGCYDQDCLPACEGFNTETEAWNCERYRRAFAKYVAQQS